MCVNTVVRFKIAALTFLLPHEHHHGGAHRVVTGYPVIGSPCQPVLEAGTRACPALLFITVGCHHPLQVNQPSWFRSVIYTLNLKMKGLPEACFGHACMSYGECRHGGRGSAPQHSCAHSCLQLHRNSVLPSPSWPANASAACPPLPMVRALLQTQPCHVFQSILVF